jgi:hypothetical protein
MSAGHCSSRVREGVFSLPQRPLYELRRAMLGTKQGTSKQHSQRRSIMKTILSALVALTLVAAAAAPASASGEFDRQGNRDAGQSSPL